MWYFVHFPQRIDIKIIDTHLIAFGIYYDLFFTNLMHGKQICLLLLFTCGCQILLIQHVLYLIIDIFAIILHFLKFNVLFQNQALAVKVQLLVYLEFLLVLLLVHLIVFEFKTITHRFFFK